MGLTCEVVEKLHGRKGKELRYLAWMGSERVPILTHISRTFTAEVNE